ncbi:MAG: DUF4105 domain-containing protein, partial [Acidobacteriota bacterium]|nr:DUF4105 domain-containing protein [Acidobacteriota bacterium]
SHTAALPKAAASRTHSKALRRGASYHEPVKRTLIILAVAIALGVALLALRRPSNERDWSADQAVLPYATIDGPMVTVRNIRNYRYTSETQYTPAYYDKTFDLRRLDSVWFFVEPFGRAGAAHTFVSFGFGPRDFLAISIEIRKEKGESFSALRGLLREYEIMYVIGDERDLVKLRTNYRNDRVFLYPVRTTPERKAAMFVSMLQRTNALRQQPEFYNTLTNTCTTNLVEHVNLIVPNRIGFSTAVLLPASSDRLAYDLGLIDSGRTFDETRTAAQINDLARRYGEDPEFSSWIRSRQSSSPFQKVTRTSLMATSSFSAGSMIR